VGNEPAKSERLRQTEHLASDVPASDRTEDFALQGNAQSPEAPAPLPGAHQTVLLPQVLRQCENQRQNRFCYRPLYRLRRNSQRDAGFGQCGHVDHVVSDSPPGDQRQAVHPLKTFPRDPEAE